MIGVGGQGRELSGRVQSDHDMNSAQACSLAPTVPHVTVFLAPQSTLTEDTVTFMLPQAHHSTKSS